MKHNPQIVFLLALILSASGCAAQQALKDMKQAKAAYTACLAENPKTPAACKREKEAYENAGLAYDSMGAGAKQNDAY